MRSTGAVSRVISQLEDIFRMHHTTRNNYCILHNEKYEKPRTKILRRFLPLYYNPQSKHNGGSSVLQILLKIALKLQIGKDYDKKE